MFQVRGNTGSRLWRADENGGTSNGEKKWVKNGTENGVQWIIRMAYSLVLNGTIMLLNYNTNSIVYLALKKE